MLDLHVPASMAAIPGRVIQPMSEHAFPHGNKHPVKRTSEERLQQMREWHERNRAKVSAKKKAQHAAMSAEKREARLARMRETTKRIEAERNARRGRV